VNATKTTPTHWLDILPATPLARGVPVTFHSIDEDQRAQGPWQGERGIATHTEAGRVMISENGAHDAGSFEAGGAEGWRIDLDDPAGFRYAVTALARNPGCTLEWHKWLLDLTRRSWVHHPASVITQEELCVLATRLAQVYR